MKNKYQHQHEGKTATEDVQLKKRLPKKTQTNSTINNNKAWRQVARFMTRLLFGIFKKVNDDAGCFNHPSVLPKCIRHGTSQTYDGHSVLHCLTLSPTSSAFKFTFIATLTLKHLSFRGNNVWTRIYIFDHISYKQMCHFGFRWYLKVTRRKKKKNNKTKVEKQNILNFHHRKSVQRQIRRRIIDSFSGGHRQEKRTNGISEIEKVITSLRSLLFR